MPTASNLFAGLCSGRRLRRSPSAAISSTAAVGAVALVAAGLFTQSFEGQTRAVVVDLAAAVSVTSPGQHTRMPISAISSSSLCPLRTLRLIPTQPPHPASPGTTHP